jgi:hypothetical protein
VSVSAEIVSWLRECAKNTSAFVGPKNRTKNQAIIEFAEELALEIERRWPEPVAPYREVQEDGNAEGS